MKYKVRIKITISKGGKKRRTAKTLSVDARSPEDAVRKAIQEALERAEEEGFRIVRRSDRNFFGVRDGETTYVSAEVPGRKNPMAARPPRTIASIIREEGYMTLQSWVRIQKEAEKHAYTRWHKTLEHEMLHLIPMILESHKGDCRMDWSAVLVVFKVGDDYWGYAEPLVDESRCFEPEVRIASALTPWLLEAPKGATFVGKPSEDDIKYAQEVAGGDDDLMHDAHEYIAENYDRIKKLGVSLMKKIEPEVAKHIAKNDNAWVRLTVSGPGHVSKIKVDSIPKERLPGRPTLIERTAVQEAKKRRVRQDVDSDDDILTIRL
jgi:hypothetical protein